MKEGTKTKLMIMKLMMMKLMMMISKELHILNPLKFAQQLTNTLLNMFRKIESVELVDVGWTRKEKEEYSPNLIKMSTYETKTKH
uniref:Ras-GEF domain-containing protein n=1 Tax=Amphimedon queenslandica TaxID=400682 RepID=A0A1X7V166_AMPQE